MIFHAVESALAVTITRVSASRERIKGKVRLFSFRIFGEKTHDYSNTIAHGNVVENVVNIWLLVRRKQREA
jgi:hypothetical protein